MRRTCAAAVIAVLALSACSSDDTDEASGQEPSAPATAAAAADEDSVTEEDSVTDEDSAAATGSAESDQAESTAAAAAAAPEEVELDESITDDVLGHEIAVTGLVRNFPIPDDLESLQETGEIVLVEVDVVAGDEYSGGVQGGFTLVSPDGSANSATTIVDAEMSAAGYPPFEGVSAGETGGGWIAFQVNTKVEDYLLSYERLPAAVIGSEEEIPGKVWEIDLP